MDDGYVLKVDVPEGKKDESSGDSFDDLSYLETQMETPVVDEVMKLGDQKDFEDALDIIYS